jgi:hypothetical protein
MESAKSQAKSEGRILSQAEFNTIYQSSMQDARNVARFSTAAVAMFSGRDVQLADKIATNALDNNFLVLMIYGGMAASAAYTMYCVGEVLCSDSTPEEKAWQVVQMLGEEAAMTIFGGALARGGLSLAKVGGKLVVKHSPRLVATGKGAADSARVALTKFFDKHPMLKFQLGDRFAQIAQAVECLESKIIASEAKVLEKFGLRKAPQASLPGKEIAQTGVTRHGVSRKIQREVTTAAELDALKNPLKIR